MITIPKAKHQKCNNFSIFQEAEMDETLNKKKGFKAPSTPVLMFAMIVILAVAICLILTFCTITQWGIGLQ